MTAPDHVADPIISSLRLGGRPHMTHIPSPHATDFVNHVSNYVPGAQLKDRIGALETRKTELTERLAEAHEPPPLLHPNMAEMYRQKVTELAAALGHPESRLEAAELLRTLVERIVLTPENGTLSITLRTASAGVITGCMLAFARVAGETAPLLFTAFGNQYWNLDPNQPTAALPLQVFVYAISPFDEWHRQAWAGALILIIMIVAAVAAVRIVTSRGMLKGAS